MEVKEASAKYLRTTGFKKTEVGDIPDDWEAANLPNIIWFQEGPGLRKWQFRLSGLKVINVTNLQETGYLDLSKTERHISLEEFERSYKHFLIDEGDVVMASSGNSYCKTAVVRQNDLPLLMNTSVIRFKAKEKVGRSFMLIYLKSKYFKDQIDLMITGGAQPNFGPAHLDKVFVPLPPTKAEQEAIAEALSDADALIESLEQLLAKKRHLKQGAMQELLTGNKRLPGFSGEWEVKRLGELSEMGSGGTPSSSNAAYYDGDIPWVSIADMTKSGKFISTTDRNLSATGLNISAAQMFPVGTVLYAMYASLGECSIASISLCSSQAILGIRAKANLDNEFLYYFLTSIKAQVKIMGQQGTQSNLNKGMVQGFHLRLPPRQEQTAIAVILSDMDTEVVVLEEKLTKVRAIKQGMMQELLTGRIRLV